jgi:dihydroorotase
VLEHVTTEEGLAFVRAHAPRVAGGITAHHLIIERNHILAGGIRPHYYCLPVAKRARHRDALRAAAVSGETCFFHGSDSAPHLDALKLAPCGCAGCFTAPVALACLAAAFEQESALERLEGFVSLHGPAFYRLPPNAETVTLERRDAPWTPPAAVETPDGPVTVFDPGFPLHWRLVAEDTSPETA